MAEPAGRAVDTARVDGQVDTQVDGQPDGVDYRAVFVASPTAAILLSPDDLVIVDANAAYERTVGVPRHELVGRPLLDAFPAGPGPGERAAHDVATRVRASLELVRRTGVPDALPPLRYDVRDASTGQYVERHWTMLTVPVLDGDGIVRHLLHKVEDLTPFMSGSTSGPAATAVGPDGDPLARDVLQRAHELREAFLRMREAAERERELALVLQASLLTPAPQSDDLGIVVRYHAAAAGSAVGGDWYDAYLQRDGSSVVAVGDVTGHDVTAAAQMGQLRALVRAIGYDTGAGPAQTLERADRAAWGLMLDTTATAVVAHIGRPGAAAAGDPTPPGASAGTSAGTSVGTSAGATPGTGAAAEAGTARDGSARTVRWSNAGHPPPALLRADGSVELLRTPSEPLLGVVPEGARTDHTVELADGDTLLLFTDGLVERRDRDFDDGLEALAAVLRGRHAEPLDALCEAVLAGLGARQHDDDVVLVAVRPRPAASGSPAPPG